VRTGTASTQHAAIRYSHTQIGWWGIAIMGAILVLILASTRWLGAISNDSAVPDVVRGVVLFVLVVTMALFSTLNVRVSDQSLVWRFGPGLLGGRIPLAEIAQVSVTRTPFWAGIGIHFIGRGWVYNVSGRDAIEVVRRDGRTTWVGTDEPAALVAAIEQARDR
jgi:hypothetical protein